MLKRLCIFLLVLASAASLLAQPTFWPFGKGLALDFSQSPPIVSNIPYHTNYPNGLNELNHSSIFTGNKDLPSIYFLNGSYYDSTGATVFRIPNYYGNAEKGSYKLGVDPYLGPLHFQVSTDTLYHVFHSGHREVPLPNQFPNSGIARWSKLYLTRLVYNPSTGYNAQVVDSFPRVTNVEETHYFKSFPSDFGPVILNWTFVAEGGAGLIHRRALQIENDRFQVRTLNIESANHFLWVMRTGVYNPLLKQIHSVGHSRVQPNLNIYDTLIYSFSLGKINNELSLIKLDSIPISPTIPQLSGYQFWQCQLDNSGRFLFFFYHTESAIAGQPSRVFLTRFDLLAGSASAINASRLDLSQIQSTISDMQFGPDNNLYFLRKSGPITRGRGDPRYGLGDFNKIARLVNPTADSLSQMTYEPNFYTSGPGEAVAFFPDYNEDLILKNPFEVINPCLDSFQLQLNIGRALDSVRWDFGEPTLGPGNTSSDLDPVVPYTEPGVYLVSVNIYFKGVLLHQFEDSVEVVPLVELDLPGDTLLCSSDSLVLNVDQGFAAQYSWNTGDTSATLKVLEEGLYRVTVSNQCGSISDSLYVEFLPQPMAQLNDFELCEQDSVLDLELPYHPEFFYHWSHGDSTYSTQISQSGDYQVTWGSFCDTLTESFTIDIRPCQCELYIPNAFSPNGDGLNDVFTIESPCEELEYQFQIFNRWGQMIHQQSQGIPTWDGTFQGELVPAGVYMYRILYRGNSAAGYEEGDRSGSIKVIR